MMDETRIYRVTPRLLVVASLFMSLFVWIGLLAASRKPEQWFFPILATFLWIGLLAFLSWVRLELTQEGFQYRNINANCWVFFDDVEKAYFKPDGEQSSAFYIKTRLDREFRLILQLYPIEAGARIFSSLDRRRIPIEVPPAHLASVRMYDEIRAYQRALDALAKGPGRD